MTLDKNQKIKELKELHIATGPEMSKFIINANSAIKESDPKKLRFIVSGVIPALQSYHNVIDDLFEAIDQKDAEIENLREACKAILAAHNKRGAVMTAACGDNDAVIKARLGLSQLTPIKE